MDHILTSGIILHGVLPARKYTVSTLILPMYIRRYIYYCSLCHSILIASANKCFAQSICVTKILFALFKRNIVPTYLYIFAAFTFIDYFTTCLFGVYML